MKKLTLFLIGVFLLSTFGLQAQVHTETLNESMAFSSNSSQNTLVVYNINGSVEVKGYNGNEVKVTADLRIEGRTTRALEQGKAEINLKVEKNGNNIYVYQDSPYTEFDLSTGRFRHKGYNWGRMNYHYETNFTIMVPNKANLELSTVNNGDVVIENVRANEISASNTNGPIRMENIAGKVYANALNKNIDIVYAENPTSDSTYESLNGDINLTVKSGLNADVSFKSLNGDIYTNFDTSSGPSDSKLTKKSGKRGTRYKMNKGTNFRIGNGGVKLTFDVLNGDVTIKS